MHCAEDLRRVESLSAKKARASRRVRMGSPASHRPREITNTTTRNTVARTKPSSSSNASATQVDASRHSDARAISGLKTTKSGEFWRALATLAPVEMNSFK